MLQRDAFHPGEINATLVGTRFAGRVEHVPSIGSTSSALLRSAAAGAPEGTALVADEQTEGRGRGGHAWHSVPGDGLYVSILSKPTLPLRRALWIALATGLAAQAAIAETVGLCADIRWPNDLLIGGLKCGGILVETAIESPLDLALDPPLRYAVIGVGINVGHEFFPPELAALATSLRLASARPLSRQALLISLLRHLDSELLELEETTEEPAVVGTERHPLLTRFAAASTWVCGKRVNVPESGGYTGTTAGLDENGFLRVAADDGHLRTVLSGGVRAAV